MKGLDTEQVILAHKFTCPYYSPEAEQKGLIKPASCGANNVHLQTDCNGECWYMSHFKELIEGLTKEASK